MSHQKFEKFFSWLLFSCGMVLVLLGAADFIFRLILVLFGAFLLNKALLDLNKPSLGTYLARLWSWVRDDIFTHF